MAAAAVRSRRALAAGFSSWLSDRQSVHVAVEVTRPESGLSSETVLLKATSESGTEELVARMAPAGGFLFPDYDLARQLRVQAALGGTDIPVAPPIALETDERWVGTPFLVMPRLPGQTLSNNPPYPGNGLLCEATPEVQTRVLNNAVVTLAQIHRLDPTTLDLGELSGGGPQLEGMLDYWDSYVSWATVATEESLLYVRALAHLRATMPESPAARLLWGDPQLVNIVYDEAFRVTAILDWEMAALGPPEVDLAWFLALHEGASETARAVMPGDPGRESLVSAYEASLGRSVQSLDWYLLFAQVRSGAIVLRIGELMAQAGVPNSWTAKVPQHNHVRRLMEVVGR